MVISRDNSIQTLPQHDIADFLNEYHSCLSEDIIATLEHTFRDFLTKNDQEIYAYEGPRTSSLSSGLIKASRSSGLREETQNKSSQPNISYPKPLIPSNFKPTYRNDTPNSFISCIYPSITEFYPPSFYITYRDGIVINFPQEYIADFLNEYHSSFSSDVIETLEKFFSHVISKKENYIYTGPSKQSFKYSDFLEKRTQILNFMDESEIKRPEKRFLKIDPSTSHGVSQNWISMTNTTHQKTILATFGVGPCIALAIYNPTTHKTMLTHFDNHVKLKDLKFYLHQLSIGAEEKLQVHISGSTNNTRETVFDLTQMIEQRKNMEIISINLGDEGEEKKFAIDARTGEIFTDFNVAALEVFGSKGFMMPNVFLEENNPK